MKGPTTHIIAPRDRELSSYIKKRGMGAWDAL